MPVCNYTGNNTGKQAWKREYAHEQGRPATLCLVAGLSRSRSGLVPRPRPVFVYVDIRPATVGVLIRHCGVGTLASPVRPYMSTRDERPAVSEARASLSIVAGRMSRVADPDPDSDPDPDLDETLKPSTQKP